MAGVILLRWQDYAENRIEDFAIAGFGPSMGHLNMIKQWTAIDSAVNENKAPIRARARHGPQTQLIAFAETVGHAARSNSASWAATTPSTSRVSSGCPGYSSGAKEGVRE